MCALLYYQLYLLVTPVLPVIVYIFMRCKLLH